MSVIPAAGNNGTRNTARDIPAATKAVTNLGHGGFQLSSSKTGHAVALHTSSGKFLYSCAVGPAFVRHTFQSGRQIVLDRVLPRKKGWYRYEHGGAFRFVRSKSGRVAVLGVSSDRKTKTLVYKNDRHVFIVANGGEVVKAPLQARNVPTTAAADEKFHSLIDNVGIWTMDDDFAGGSGSHLTGTGYVRRTASGRRVSYVNSPTQPADGYTSDGYSGYFDPGPGDTLADSQVIDRGFFDPNYDIGGDPYLAADPNATDPALDTNVDSTFDIPTDQVAAQQKCDQEHADLTHANLDANDSAMKESEACGGKKSIGRSPQAAKKKKPPKKPGKGGKAATVECTRARLDHAQAVAAQQEALRKYHDCMAAGHA